MPRANHYNMNSITGKPNHPPHSVQVGYNPQRHMPWSFVKAEKGRIERRKTGRWANDPDTIHIDKGAR
jgi:hypothetical protein